MGMNMNNHIVVGIDLGTTNTVTAYASKNGEPVILTRKLVGQNRLVLPSVVYFDRDGNVIVGEEAKNLLGKTTSNNGIAQVKLEQLKPRGKARCLRVGQKQYMPEDIQSIILRKAMDDANNELRRRGELGKNDPNVRDVIITIPAFFTEDARRQTQAAADKAGLNVLGLIHEPSAAALCYCDKHKEEANRTMLVLDLGGGTFDICLLEKNGNVINVLEQSGGPEEGGYFWDRELLIFALEQIMDDACINEELFDDDGLLEEYLRSDDGRLSIINAEKCREELTDSVCADLTVFWKGKGYSVNVTREYFNNCCELLVDGLLERIRTVCEKRGRLGKDGHFTGIDKVILVGGATRMPVIEQILYDKCGARQSMIVSENTQTRKDWSSETCVAIGAAIYGRNIGYYRLCWEQALNVSGPVREYKETDLRMVPDDREPDLIIKIPTNYTYGIKVKKGDEPKDYVFNVIMKGEKLSTVKKINQRFTTYREKRSITISVYESVSNEQLEVLDEENIHELCGHIQFQMATDIPVNTSVWFYVGVDPKGLVSIVAECNGEREQLIIN